MSASKANQQDPREVKIDDLTLSAWLDEELDPAEARQVQAAVDAQVELQQRVARMMVNERRLREHYTEMARTRPLPEAMQALLADDEAPARPWFLRLTDWTIAALPRPVMATAGIGLALAIGLILGGQGQQNSDSSASLRLMTAVDRNHHWFELLESAPSGDSVSLADGQLGQVAMSYRDVQGQWCRQFEIQSPSERSAMAAVACRQDESWQIGLAQPVPLRRQAEGVFRAASGEGAAAIDAYIMARIDGDLLIGATEGELIEQGWQ